MNSQLAWQQVPWSAVLVTASLLIVNWLPPIWDNKRSLFQRRVAGALMAFVCLSVGYKEWSRESSAASQHRHEIWKQELAIKEGQILRPHKTSIEEERNMINVFLNSYGDPSKDRPSMVDNLQNALHAMVSVNTRIRSDVEKHVPRTRIDLNQQWANITERLMTQLNEIRVEIDLNRKLSLVSFISGWEVFIKAHSDAVDLAHQLFAKLIVIETSRQNNLKGKWNPLSPI